MGYMCLFQFWFPQGIYLGGGLLGHAAAAKSFQSCLTLCNPIDSSPPGSGGFIPSFLRTLHTVFHAAAKSLQSYPTLCDPIDGSPLGSSVPGILQARILEWVAISSFNAWKWKVKKKSLSHVPLLATPWTAAYHAPLSTGFSRQEYWNGLPLPSPIVAVSIYIPTSRARVFPFLHILSSSYCL